MSKPSALISRLKPAPRGGGYSDPNHWIWCGSAIRDDQGTYHLFASQWPKTVPMTPNWVTNSMIVRATADHPEGPYSFAGVVLGAREPGQWDAMMTHNPTVHRCPVTGKYLLFYTGTTYDGPMPTERVSPEKYQEARRHQRIGLATADHPAGPWRRPDAPVIEPRPGRWDAYMTTNAAPCVLADGRILLAYKSTASAQDKLRYGLAAADRFDAPFARVADEPLFNFSDPSIHIEDAYLWHDTSAQPGERFQMIFKDMTDKLTGESHAGVHAVSPDALSWRLADEPKAYSRTVTWDDGETTRQSARERPQLLIENGRPTHLFNGTGAPAEKDGFSNASHTWCMVQPIAP